MMRKIDFFILSSFGHSNHLRFSVLGSGVGNKSDEKITSKYQFNSVISYYFSLVVDFDSWIFDVHKLCYFYYYYLLLFPVSVGKTGTIQIIPSPFRIFVHSLLLLHFSPFDSDSNGKLLVMKLWKIH